ncbi:MAG: hypothetical protein LUF28_06435 [Clostridiales bacterium]|nr:hypothetical protein [Clostridiales bacterium]
MPQTSGFWKATVRPLTLVSRAAVDGGMLQKSAFSLCTEHREKLNASETREEMASLTNQILE